MIDFISGKTTKSNNTSYNAVTYHIIKGRDMNIISKLKKKTKYKILIIKEV